MLQNILGRYDKRELIYIPHRSEKGDCPYCDGVLRRDFDVETRFRLKEGYICSSCGFECDSPFEFYDVD